MKLRQSDEPVLVACPDARPPAFQAVIGLHRARDSRGFLTACYYNPDSRIASLARRLSRERFLRLSNLASPPQFRNTVGCGEVNSAFRRNASARGTVRQHATRFCPCVAKWRTNYFDAQLGGQLIRPAQKLSLLSAMSALQPHYPSAVGWESKPY